MGGERRGCGSGTGVPKQHNVYPYAYLKSSCTILSGPQRTPCTGSKAFHAGPRCIESYHLVISMKQTYSGLSSDQVLIYDFKEQASQVVVKMKPGGQWGDSEWHQRAEMRTDKTASLEKRHIS
jgi:hypothetical protein